MSATKTLELSLVEPDVFKSFLIEIQNFQISIVCVDYIDQTLEPKPK